MGMASDELLLMILESVANDYEQLDQIADQIAAWTGTPPNRLDIDKIRATLADAIECGYIAAYELNSTGPRAVRVAVDPQAFDKHWFLITDLGKARCCESPELFEC